MLDQIKPGTRIRVKVTKKPTNLAAKKTIVRLLGKDAVVKAEDKRLRKTRKAGFRQKPRGGRPWDLFMVKQPAVKPEIGVAGTITATVDVLTDLKSVTRFVEVTPA